MAERVARVVGLDSFDVYIHQVRSRGVAVELGAPNILFVPSSLVDAPEAQRVFLLAKPLLGFATGVGVLAKLTPREVEVLVAAVLRFVAPTHGQGLTSEEVLEETKKRLLRAASRKSRKTLEDAAKQLLAHGPLDFIAWAEKVDRRLIQLATLVADDLVGSVDILRRLERELQHREGAELVRRSPPIADLVRFWVSADAMSLRDAAVSSASVRSNAP